MGCISSKPDINDLHPNIFRVMNVDELGNRISHGQLEITETDLVLYQRKKAPVRWPLRSLRRYGYDAELFSFESGRRCPTGPGIYAFRCQRAEQLFNLLQTHIQVRNIVGEDAVSREFPVSSVPGPAMTSRNNVTGDSNYLEPSNLRSAARINASNSIRFSSQNGGGPTRLGSFGSSSNGPLSPQETSPSPPLTTIPTVPVPTTTNGNSPGMYYANEDFFFSTTSASTTATVITSVVNPIENGVQQFQKSVWQPYQNSDFISGTVVPSLPVDIGNKTSRQSVGSGEGIASICSETVIPCAQNHSAPSYINVDLSSIVGPLSPTCIPDGESTYAHLELANDVQQNHLYMNVIPGPENSASIFDKPSTIRPKASQPCYGKQQQEWEFEEPHHSYANLEPSEIGVARSHLPKRLSATERIPPLPLLSPASQSQHNPITPPSGILRTVNYIVLDLDQSKSDSGNTNSFHQPLSPIVSIPSSTLSLPPESPKRVSEGYATIDFNKTVALSHSVNPNLDNDSEGSRKTRHNSTINDLVTPSTRHSSSE